MKFQYQVAPDIYQGDSINRFLLGKTGKNMLVIIGVNPSTANNIESDKTINDFVIPISLHNGYDGWLMVNSYPEIATKFHTLGTTLNPKLHQDNLHEIALVLKQYVSYDVWCAWGGYIKERTYLPKCLFDVKQLLMPKMKNALSIGQLSDGLTPKHPIRQPQTSILNPFTFY